MLRKVSDHFLRDGKRRLGKVTRQDDSCGYARVLGRLLHVVLGLDGGHTGAELVLAIAEIRGDEKLDICLWDRLDKRVLPEHTLMADERAVCTFK